MDGRYNNKAVAFLTQHGKAPWVEPILTPGLGCRIQLTQGYDTDLLGTFSGDIIRPDSQLGTARMKARIGMQLTGLPLGMASEGAFVADPFGGLMPWNVEVLLWVDDENHIEVVGMAQGPTRSLHRAVRCLPDLESFAIEAGFPEHHLMLRPQSESDPRVRKGLNDWETLRRVFTDCQRESSNSQVYAENDHRAFCHPTRQRMIQRATVDLLTKLQSACPACSLPGFSIIGHQPGLPCRMCGHPTKLARAYTWHCKACQHRQESMVAATHAEPARCDACNP